MVQRVKSLTRPERRPDRRTGDRQEHHELPELRLRAGRGAAGGAGARGAGGGGGGGRGRGGAGDEAADGHDRKPAGGRPAPLSRRICRCDPWVFFSRLVSCCVPDALISNCGVQNIQAWREKIALCFIILVMQGVVAYITFGLNMTLCSATTGRFPAFVANNTVVPPTLARAVLGNNTVMIWGRVYRLADVQQAAARQNAQLNDSVGGLDASGIFTVDSAAAADPCRPAACPECEARLPPRKCSMPGASLPGGCLRYDQLARTQPLGEVTYQWEELGRGSDQLLVFNGLVLNLTEYFSFTGGAVPATTDPWYVVDATIRRNLGLDSTISMLSTPQTAAFAPCMAARFRVGILSKESVGCGAASVIMIAALTVVLGIILGRFFMAVTFSWFLSKGMVKISAEGGDRIDLGRTPDADFPDPGSDATQLSPVNAAGDPLMYTMMLVTCYSEGESSLRCTLESLAETTYDEKYKMFFIIADGIIKGQGEAKSTPDLCLGMLDVAPEMTAPTPSSYIAVADGEKQHNMAKVYAGHFRHKQHSVPAILVVKCGTPGEANNPKPGNRGKRDSQVLLMHFLSRVLFDDRMTELDYDLFWKIQYLMGVTPDRFELILMVDADTKVLPDSLSYMVRAMDKSPMIMGLCGETRIANKYDSWVTWIQVFEYYISHHLGKAFESVFGGVTCLPGCFCMYRIKARKNRAWVPILANPDIVQEYCQNVVDTLHKKNLLLLGEDRFLSTLMLRNFPKRQMVFVPQAMCKTVVPDTSEVLFSQRRRWINSTIHNLLELVLVKDLCGIACLSMQFVVLMELIGTITLPAAIVFTFVLIISLIVSPSSAQVIPLVMLLSVLGLPAVLILLTTRKMVYVSWMLVYLLALPVWNLLLPVYAFWHFDDFSWGQTRVVAGEGKGGGAHGDKEGEFDTSAIVMRKWSEWEKEVRGGDRASVLRHGSVVGGGSVAGSWAG